MKVRHIMTGGVIRIGPEESAAVAARTLAHYNVGALPVCGVDGQLCGVVTDRDIVIRCLASGRPPEKTPVREIMTGNVFTVEPETDTAVAAALMARRQVRRLPVVDQGHLCGMVSLADLSRREDSALDAADVLSQISCNIAHW